MSTGYTKDQYLQMIEKFNKMDFGTQLDTIFRNPGVLKAKITVEVDVVGVDDDKKEAIKKENWFTINHGNDDELKTKA